MNKKGFTLIELLAVIVILAIIALIATPMIMGVIDDARKGAAEASANGYIEAVENTPVYSMLETGNDTGLPTGIYEISDDTLKNVKVKGEAPKSGWVAVGDNGVVVAACLEFSNYSKLVGYTDTDHAKATIAKDDEIAKKPTTGTAADAKTSMSKKLNPSS